MNNQNNNLSHIISLPNLNFKTQMNIPIDANAHIKSILNIQPYIYDTSCECLNSKCEVKGKIGVKIIYLDIDNVYNTLTDELAFSENINEPNLTSDVQVLLSNEQIATSVDFDEKYLKINFTINAKLVGNINLNLALCDTDSPDLICQKQTVPTTYCVDKIEARTNLNTNLQLPYRANKILNISICPTISKIENNSNYVSITGNSLVQLLYDVDSDASCELKYFCDSFSWKYEVPAKSNSDDTVYACAKIDNSTLNFTTELNDSQTSLALDYDILTTGFVYRTADFELCNDIYSITNELETNYSEREFDNIQPLTVFSSNVDGELQLSEQTQVDEIISCVNHSCLITQCYDDQQALVVEGVLTSNLIYLNEEHEVMSMNCELPFSISKDMGYNFFVVGVEATVTGCKAKIKRGNTLNLDYELSIEACLNKKQSGKVLDSINPSKKIEYGDIAFQICVAKPNECLWEFCKRTHTSEAQLKSCNKEIPPVFQGGEKIIIYR